MASESAPADKRRFPRLEAPLDGTWDGASGLRNVRVTSLSLGGCFVDGLGTPTVGEQLRVSLQFADGTRVGLSGEVVYLDRVQGFGVRFIDLASAAREHLTRGLQLHGLKHPNGEPPQGTLIEPRGSAVNDPATR